MVKVFDELSDEINQELVITGSVQMGASALRGKTLRNMWRLLWRPQIIGHQASFLSAGSLISLHIYALHRNSAVWPDPEVLHL
jgi:hypothetical protein